MCNGGRTTIPAPFFTEWFPFLRSRQDSVITAEAFLKRQGYESTMRKINDKEKPVKNIVIIGSSHSAFSAAWTILHGPALYNRSNYIRGTKHKSMPEAPIKRNKNCRGCCSCNDGESPCRNDCVCHCYGFFQYEEWSSEDMTPRHLKPGSVKMIFRDQKRLEEAANVLRGDAKVLYNQLCRGIEKRVQMFKAPTFRDQA